VREGGRGGGKTVVLIVSYPTEWGKRRKVYALIALSLSGGAGGGEKIEERGEKGATRLTHKPSSTKKGNEKGDALQIAGAGER